MGASSPADANRFRRTSAIRRLAGQPERILQAMTKRQLFGSL
jgi:hypothetical protein